MALEARGIWFAYRGRQWVLRGVDASIAPGEAVAFIGPNGAGKTTLLKILGLLLKPQRGTVYLDGVDCRNCPRRIRSRVVFVHAEPIALPASVEYNIAIGLMLRGADKSDAIEKARSLLAEYGLSRLEGLKASELSMGLRQLVSILRAILVKPRYLLLDEPTAYLDRRHREVLIEILDGLRREGVGIGVATHDEKLVELLGCRVYEMAQSGRTLSPRA